MKPDWATMGRALDVMSGLAEVARRLWGPAPTLPPPVDDRSPAGDSLAAAGAVGHLEARLTGVVVAALKEAFDRDRARLDLEREQIEAERRRADQLLRLERRRQAADRALYDTRLSVGAGLGIWVSSIACVLVLPGFSAGLPKVLVGLAWLTCAMQLTMAFVSRQRIARWLDEDEASARAPRDTVSAMSWILVAVALLLVGGAVLAAL